MIKVGTDDFTKLMVTWKGKILTLVIILICSFGIYSGTMGDEYISAKSYPVEASEFLLKEQKNGNIDFNTMKLYNDYNYGSYLLFRGIPVFIDSRADLYSPEFNEGVNIFDDYMNISGISTYYETKFEEYGITHVMMYRNSKLNMIISRDENYKNIYVDENFVIYERLNANSDNGEEG